MCGETVKYDHYHVSFLILVTDWMKLAACSTVQILPLWHLRAK